MPEYTTTDMVIVFWIAFVAGILERLATRWFTRVLRYYLERSRKPKISYILQANPDHNGVLHCDSVLPRLRIETGSGPIQPRSHNEAIPAGRPMEPGGST